MTGYNTLYSQNTVCVYSCEPQVIACSDYLRGISDNLMVFGNNFQNIKAIQIKKSAKWEYLDPTEWSILPPNLIVINTPKINIPNFILRIYWEGGFVQKVVTTKIVKCDCPDHEHPHDHEGGGGQPGDPFASVTLSEHKENWYTYELKWDVQFMKQEGDTDKFSIFDNTFITAPTDGYFFITGEIKLHRNGGNTPYKLFIKLNDEIIGRGFSGVDGQVLKLDKERIDVKENDIISLLIETKNRSLIKTIPENDYMKFDFYSL